MSVKLFYDTPSQIEIGQLIGGFCYCRQTGPAEKPAQSKSYVDTRISIDIWDPDRTEETKPTRENPIIYLVDFGVFPVESSTYRDFSIYASAGVRHLANCKVLLCKRAH